MNNIKTPFLAKHYVILLIVFCSILQFSKCSQITVNNTSTPITTYGIFLTGSNQNKTFLITAPLKLVKPSKACSPIHQNLTGFIALIDSEDCYAQKKIKYAQEAGALGAVVRKFAFKPPLSYMGDGHRHPDIHIPAVQVDDDDFFTMRDALKNQMEVTIVMSPDPCPWDVTYGNRSLWISFSVIFGTVHLITLIVAITKLVGVRWSIEASKVKVVCLVLQVIVACTRLAYMLDPLSTWGIFSETVTFVISSLHTPFSLMSYALLGNYWDSVSEGPRVIVKLTSKTLIAFSVLLLAGEISTWYFRFVLINTNFFTTIFICIYMVMIFVTSAYYFYHGMKIVRLLKEKATGETIKRLQKLNRFILVIAACWTASFISLLVLIIVGVGPYVNTCVYWVVAITLAIASATQVSMFPWRSLPLEEETTQDSQTHQMETYNNQAFPVDSSDSGPVLSSTEEIVTPESSNSTGFEM